MSIKVIDENNESLDRLVSMLKQEQVALHRAFETFKPKPPPKSESQQVGSDSTRTDGGIEGFVVTAVTSAVIVELTKEAVRVVIKWLKERRDGHLENPRLQLIAKGKTIELDAQSIENLANVFEAFMGHSK